MKLGLWGARMDNSGLGQQTYEFYRHMKPEKTMVVDISVLERLPDRVLKQYPERYPDGIFIHGMPNEADMRSFLDGLDVVFIAESSYGMQFYRIAREMGVKTAVQYNYEFFDWSPNSMWANDMPDLFIAPSQWHYDQVSQWIEGKSRQVYLHVPVARDKIRRRFIDTAYKFVHIAGRPATHDRNGTFDFLEAISLSNGDLEGIVYTQDKTLEQTIKQEYPSVKVRKAPDDYTELYSRGSILVLPRKYGGNCLPMNEALAAGMPVIMTKVSPQTEFLPEKWLVTANKANDEDAFAPRGFPIDIYQADQFELLMRMRWFNSLSNGDMAEQSQIASDLAQTISWDEMKPKYEEVFEALCNL